MTELLNNPFILIAVGAVIGTAIGFYAAQSYFQSSPSICSGDYLKAKSKIISHARAKEMFDSYTSRRAELIERSEGNSFSATRFGSLKFTVMKDYVDYLTCIDSRLRSSGHTGIESVRIYFANYPDQFANGDEMHSVTIDGNTHSYARRNTFFMLPTLLDVDSQEKGFKISGDDNDISYQTIENFLKTTRDSATMESESGSLILNEVGLTPPPPEQRTDF